MLDPVSVKQQLISWIGQQHEQKQHELDTLMHRT